LEILPVLQDYFFDDWSGLADVLGKEIVNVDEYKINQEILDDPVKLQEALSVIAGANPEPDES
jgi:hypothetical protein